MQSAKEAYEDAELRSEALTNILIEMEVIQLVHSWNHPYRKGAKAPVKDRDFTVQPCDGVGQ